MKGTTLIFLEILQYLRTLLLYLLAFEIMWQKKKNEREFYMKKCFLI